MTKFLQISVQAQADLKYIGTKQGNGRAVNKLVEHLLDGYPFTQHQSAPKGG